MLPIKKILFATDFSECANYAFKYSVILAEKYNAELVMFHAIVMFRDDPNNPDYRFPDMTDCYKTIEKASHKEFDRLCSDWKKLKTKNVVVRGFSPAEEILQYAEAKNMDLIVMGTHGRSAITRFFLGSTAEKVVRFSLCPVVTLREEPKEFIKTRRYGRILFPTDYSEYAQKALKWPVELAKDYHTELDVLHVIEQNIPPQYYSAEISSIFDLDRKLKKRAMKALARFLEGVDRKEVDVRRFIREGKSDVEIVKFAEKRSIDLIVMSSHGMSGIERILMGSTTERVLRRALCPLLTIKG
ncbi:hypothetical protein CEE39_03895 [bacterium (candidate division B38) B3_B38]|nr:MAG: hypothetical protein CEE39_03895 [bacterium (candidate division B38) B3_B38]